MKMKFDRIYKLIMEDTFNDLPYQEQRERVQSSLEQGAPVLWQSIEQFDLFTLLLEFSNEWENYKYDDWGFENSKQYAQRLKNLIDTNTIYFPATSTAYFSTQENVQKTWQDVANRVWTYYGI